MLLKYSATNYDCGVYWTVESVLNSRNNVWTTLLYILFKKAQKVCTQKDYELK